MSVNSTKAALGPGEAFTGWGLVSNPYVSLGGTMGGAKFNVEQEFADLMMDQLGSKAMEVALVGFLPSLELPLAEYTLSNWSLVMPGSTVAGSANPGFRYNGNIGTQAIRDGYTHRITFKPYVRGVADSDAESWITLPCGFLQSTKVSADYSTKGQRTINATAIGLPDVNDANNRLILGFADPS